MLLQKAANARQTVCYLGAEAIERKDGKEARTDAPAPSADARRPAAIAPIIMDFAAAGGSSWVALSPVEQSIKQKIEAAGVPLRDWDIEINYGIKTGCNEAFIVDEAARAGDCAIRT